MCPQYLPLTMQKQKMRGFVMKKPVRGYNKTKRINKVNWYIVIIKEYRKEFFFMVHLFRYVLQIIYKKRM